MTGGVGPLVVALIGGLAAGKSTVAAAFARRGVPVIDSDAIAHSLTRPDGAALPALRQLLGQDILDADGGLDRPALRERVFRNPALRERIEALLHPAIQIEAEHRLAELDADYALLALPLFPAQGYWHRRVDRVLAVDCPVDLQRERALRRPGLSPAVVDGILAAQQTRAERLAVAHDVIENSGEMEAIDSRVRDLHAVYVGLARIRSEGQGGQARAGAADESADKVEPGAPAQGDTPE